jgi:hypothetical protein
MQGPLSSASVPQVGRGRALVTQRTQPGLHGDLPDAQHSAAVHAALRLVATRLQRSPVRVRWRARHHASKGKNIITVYIYIHTTRALCPKGSRGISDIPPRHARFT